MSTTITTTTTTTTTTTDDPLDLVRQRLGGSRQLFQGFRMTRPQQGRGILLRNYAAGNGTIIVTLTNTNPNATMYFVRVGNLTANLTLDANINPAMPPGTHLPLTNIVGNVFQAANIPVQGIPALAPRANNQRIAIGAYTNVGVLLEAVTFPFIAIPENTNVSVSVPAKGCLFFAYTAFGAVLPNNAVEKLPDNLPTTIPAPIDAAKVAISVPKVAGVEQKWNNEHGPCDANGQAGDNDTTVAAYRSAVLGSENMKRLGIETAPGTYLDGLLAGMWDYGPENAANPLACVELVVGIGPAQLPILPIAPLPPPPPPSGAPIEPLSPINLLLGLHMDDNWAQCSGKLDVSLLWS